ncbi:2-hydroxyacid dehydrogenase [Terrimonas ferruginea]|uniref:2-hydroxyacid dehydrogenase n=1 Tax=Terrimonas ferruginea TaxID=249 RepID=UPI000410ABB6|nr:D-glycerate dehydrogenase [Terrimonas ferruginea]
MNVFVSRLIPEAGISKMEEAGIKVTVWKEDRPLTSEELIHHVQQHDALLCMNREKIDKAFLNACPHLKVIALYSVGYDSMDVAEATRLGIPMSNTPDVLSDATADIAFTLLLAVSRKAFFHHRRILNDEWDFFRPTANLGIELKNKTLGIFGLGRIGLEMAKRCRGAYNMQVIYHNRNRNQEAEKEIDARYVSFDELLEQSDVLSLHTALTPETKDRFTLNEFRKMRSKAIFINTARGAIHREEDLLKAILDGIIWGAGLDVTNPEPMSPDSPLLRLPSVCVTPHIGSATEEARTGMALVAAENIIAGLRGERLPNVIDPSVYDK